jgi:hypothetical protein
MLGAPFAFKLLLALVLLAHGVLFVVLYRRYVDVALARARVPTAWVRSRPRPGEGALRAQAAISAIAVTTATLMGVCFVLLLGTLLIGSLR